MKKIRTGARSTRRLVASSILIAAGLLSGSASADKILLWTGGQGHGGISNAQTFLTNLGHTVTQSSTVPADLSSFDSLWAMDYLNGPNAADEQAMVATFLNSDRGVYAQFEWSCCVQSQVNWTNTLSPLLIDPFLISGSQGSNANAVAEPNEVFGLTTTPNSIPLLQINATAHIATIPPENVVYRLNGTPVVGAYVGPQFVSGHGCIVLSGDIEQIASAPQGPQWVANSQYFLQQCKANPPPICGDGFLAMAETCDDGNGAAGDGCSDTCQIEPGYDCTNDFSQNPVSTCVATCGTACTLGVGACQASGIIQCMGMQVYCDAMPGLPSAELCDSVDNDCNGSTDEVFNLGAACSVGVGACKVDGVIACDGSGGAACDAVAGQPTAEVCDAVDNDCDGAVDNGFNVGGQCFNGLGSCEVEGVIVCDGAGGAVCNAVPLCGDADGDGLSDVDEGMFGTDPNDQDSDDDGVIDGAEQNPGADADNDGTINVLDPDSDNDGIFDGTEMGLDCSNPDTDLSAGHCVADGDMGETTTDPLDPDTDGGGASDGSEDFDHDGTVDPGETDPAGQGDDTFAMDSDGDGISDGAEIAAGTDPGDGDTDDDGVLDGLEWNPTQDSDGDGLINMRDPDSDNDGIFDGTELGKNCLLGDTEPGANHCIPDGDMGQTTTNPLDPDTDDGGVNDGAEDFDHDGVIDPGETDPTAGHGADDATVIDSDGDGLSDGEEMEIGSDPNDTDTDDDGVLDGDEANPTTDDDGDGLNNANDPDSDNDEIFDGTEMGLGCPPGAANCVADADMGQTKTNPLEADTDGGGVKDGVEDKNHNGVVDAGETDPNNPADDLCTQSSECAVPGEVCDPSTSQCVAPKCDAATVCPMADACHLDGVCDAATGECNYPNKPNNTPCADNNVCTEDKCQSGACVSLSVLDGTLCTENGKSGQCIAGHCLVDSGGDTGGAGGAAGNGQGGDAGNGGNGSGNSGGAAGNGQGGDAGAGGGSGANGNGEDASYSLHGGACSTGGSPTGEGAALGALAMALLAIRRRRRAA